MENVSKEEFISSLLVWQVGILEESVCEYNLNNTETLWEEAMQNNEEKGLLYIEFKKRETISGNPVVFS